MDQAEVRRRMYRAPTPRERERWHTVWLLAQGWTAAAVAQVLERNALAHWPMGQGIRGGWPKGTGF